MADTKTAAQRRHPVPHQHFSGAKIIIIPETSKQFPKFNIKQRGAGPENLRPLCIELWQ
jgi:hypothetical protein